MGTVQPFITQLVTDVAIAALALLAAIAVNAVHKLTQKIQLQTKQIKSDEQRQLLLEALDDVENLTEKTVTAIEQTTAKTLREAVKQGTKDRSELLALSRDAYTEIVHGLKPEYITLIENNYGNFSTYLSKVIESKVFELKNGS